MENTNSFELYESQKRYEGKNERTIKPNIAGILLIISGIIIFFIFALGNIELGFENLEDYFIHFSIGIFALICAIICILGGYYAIVRKHHKITIYSSVLAIISFVIFGLIAILLLMASEGEFES